jgi:hypothetical protein
MCRLPIMRIFLSIVLLFSTFSLLANDQDPKILKIQERVDQAEARHNSNYAAKISADSLVRVGDEIQKTAAIEIVLLNSERKNIDRAFVKVHKPLEKQLKSKDKETVKEAKIEINGIVKEYKTTVKEWDIRHRAAMKELNNGQKIITRGKNNLKKAKIKHKESGKKLKEAEKVLDKTMKDE